MFLNELERVMPVSTFEMVLYSIKTDPSHAIRHSMTIILRILFLFMTTVAVAQPAKAGKKLLPPAPPSLGPSAFFASERACASSGRFSTQECAEAFDRVDALLRERAPKFADKVDCVLQFHLCARSDDGYRPAALGVEIIRARKALIALPMLAVETGPDLWRDPEPAPGRDIFAEAATRGEGPRRAPASPYGALGLQAASLATLQPPSIASYHRFVEEVQLRLAIFEQGAKPRLNWRAER
jgi:hypothetical protein